ncbi:MAG: Clp protease N-terminal domain-containing protein [Planctomycetaceae bacterium]
MSPSRSPFSAEMVKMVEHASRTESTCGSVYVTTVDLLIAMLELGDDSVVEVFQELGHDIDSLPDLLRERSSSPERWTEVSASDLTNGVGGVLMESVVVALSQGLTQAENRHVLLSILKIEDCTARIVLAELNVNVDALVDALSR